ncbi:cupin domain-containing protein [candidate division KSB1 bacterium]|nr:cupin domain-containing protein [candidate division KSB1 bacterium]
MKIKIDKPSGDELDRLGVFSWPVWEKAPSTFPWHYDEQEVCYFLEGKVVVVTGDEQVSIGKGDLVTFPRGLDCEWRVLEAVRKHYKFS